MTITGNYQIMKLSGGQCLRRFEIDGDYSRPLKLMLQKISPDDQVAVHFECLGSPGAVCPTYSVSGRSISIAIRIQMALLL